MKRIIGTVLLVMLLILSINNIYGSGEMTVDLRLVSQGTVGEDYSSNVAFGTGSAGANYFWVKLQNGSPNFAKLGTFDLSNIGSIRFDMANGDTSTFTDKSYIIFSKDAEGTEVIAKTLAITANGWVNPIEVVIEDVDTDYNGPVYLSFVFSGSTDGILIANVKFIPEETENPTESPETEEPVETDENPETNDSVKMTVLSLLVLSAISFYMIKIYKRKAV